MSTCYLVCESQADANFLKTLLDDTELSGKFEYLACNGRSSAIARATSKVVLRQESALLVVDADVSDRNQAEIQRRELLSMIGYRPQRYRVVVALPSIEGCLFESRRFVEHYFGDLDDTMRELVRLDPKAALRLRNPHWATGVGSLIDLVASDPELRQSLLETELLREIRHELHDLIAVPA